MNIITTIIAWASHWVCSLSLHCAFNYLFHLCHLVFPVTFVLCRIINNILVPDPAAVTQYNNNANINNSNNNVISSNQLSFAKTPDVSPTISSGTLNSLSSLAKLVLSTSVRSALKSENEITPKPFKTEYQVNYGSVKFRTPPPLAQKFNSFTGRSQSSDNFMPYLPSSNSFVVKSASVNGNSPGHSTSVQSLPQPSVAQRFFNNYNTQTTTQSAINPIVQYTPLQSRNTFRLVDNSNSHGSINDVQTFNDHFRQISENLLSDYTHRSFQTKIPSSPSFKTNNMNTYHNFPSGPQTLGNFRRRQSRFEEESKLAESWKFFPSMASWPKLIPLNSRVNERRSTVKRSVESEETSSAVNNQDQESKIADNNSELAKESRIMTGFSINLHDDEVSFF